MQATGVKNTMWAAWASIVVLGRASQGNSLSFPLAARGGSSQPGKRATKARRIHV